MNRIEKKLTVDDKEITFVLRKPKFGDTIDAMDHAVITLDPVTGRPKGSASQMMKVAAFRVARCIVSPEEYRDAVKIRDLPEEAVQELIGALDELTSVPQNLETSSNEASAPGTQTPAP